MAGAALAFAACRSPEPVVPEPPAAPRETAELSPTPAPAEPAVQDGPFSYVLPVDYGIRTDSAGYGGFRAKRSHGEHNGLDLLAPLGTPVLAFCTGEAKSGTTGDFGDWVKLVCPLPPSFGGREAGYLSLFYAHLSEQAVDRDWQTVEAGQALGAVGKTGNASGPRVEPHLHFEAIVNDDEQAAKSETHSGLNQSSNWAVARFLSRLFRSCLEPDGFAPANGELQRARRIDPFVLQTCLVRTKPALRPAPAPLRIAGEKWSAHYTARTFDADIGRTAALRPATFPELDRHYFTGTWLGESRGTQIFAELRVREDGAFSTSVQTGPDGACKLDGQLRLSGGTLTFDVRSGTCADAESRFEREHVIDATPSEFVMADAGAPDAVVRRASGELEGLVWVFRRK